MLTEERRPGGRSSSSSATSISPVNRCVWEWLRVHFQELLTVSRVGRTRTGRTYQYSGDENHSEGSVCLSGQDDGSRHNPDFGNFFCGGIYQ